MITYGNIIIPYRKKFRYLGIYITENLNWDYHLQSIQSKLNFPKYILHKIKQNTYVTPYQLRLLYIIHVRPIIEYASPVFYPYLNVKQVKLLESIQHNIACIIWDLPINTSIYITMGYMGCMDINYRMSYLSTKYLLRALNTLAGGKILQRYIEQHTF